MRIGASILYKRQRLAQSYGYQKHRSLGDFNRIVQAMSDKHIDEIVIMNIDRLGAEKSCKETIEIIEKTNIDTPVVYGGGLPHCLQELIEAKNIERFLVSSAFICGDIVTLSKLEEVRGKQSIIGCLPVLNASYDGVEVFCSATESSHFLKFDKLKFLCEYVDELALIDVKSYGFRTGYNWKILNRFERMQHKCIISGGITSGDISQAKQYGIAGVILDNFFMHNVKVQKHYANL